MNDWLFDDCADPNEEVRQQAIAHQRQLTKPAGSLAELEDIAIRLAALQGHPDPQLERLWICVFAGDHGVMEENVSAYPQSVTAEMLRNFASGGAAISVLARGLNAPLEVINLGCVQDPPAIDGVTHLALGHGTANLTKHPAMTRQQLSAALAAGRDSVERALGAGTQLYIGGEMGIGNSTAAAALASALLSMWINSTATVLVMLPIALSLVDGLDEDHGRERLAVPLLLGVSYGASIGGMATPVGTPPNLVLLQLWEELFPGRPRIGFGQWMSFGIPFAIVFLGLSWWLLVRWLEPVKGIQLEGRDAVRERLRELGRPTRDERWSGIVFAITALLWVTGDGLSFGGLDLPGWRDVPMLASVGDPAVAVAGAVLLFILPQAQSHGRLLEWDWAEKRLPWGVLLLIGAGMALAMGIARSGLDQVIGGAMQAFGNWPVPLMLLALVGVVCLLSELGSNTATASLVLPILARTAESWGSDPVLLLVPATLAASLGFMLPVASPMQTIVFATGRIPVRRMVRAGLWIDAAGAVVLVALYLLLGRLVFA